MYIVVDLVSLSLVCFRGSLLFPVYEKVPGCCEGVGAGEVGDGGVEGFCGGVVAEERGVLSGDGLWRMLRVIV